MDKLNCIFFKVCIFLIGYVFVVVVFHRAYCIEAKTIIESRSRNTRKNTAKLLQGLQAHITKKNSYRHIFMPVMMRLLILTEAFFPIRLP